MTIAGGAEPYVGGRGQFYNLNHAYAGIPDGIHVRYPSEASGNRHGWAVLYDIQENQYLKVYVISNAKVNEVLKLAREERL